MSSAEPANAPPRQLQMVWPADRAMGPDANLPSGYALRCLRDGEEDAYLALMHGAGFAVWTRTMLDEWRRRVLPGGLFVVEHVSTGQLVATAMATHNPTEQHPDGGELGWVAGDSAHSGKRLGEAVCCAVMAHFLRLGYRRIYLRTDDFRLPAIRTYLRMGFEPLEDDASMPGRWRAVLQLLSHGPSRNPVAAGCEPRACGLQPDAARSCVDVERGAVYSDASAKRG